MGNIVSPQQHIYNNWRYKDVDPELLQGVLNFIAMNTQIPEKIDVPEDVKQDLGMSTTDILGTDVKDEIGTL